jgi:hypothetical protein
VDILNEWRKRYSTQNERSCGVLLSSALERGRSFLFGVASEASLSPLVKKAMEEQRRSEGNAPLTIQALMDCCRWEIYDFEVVNAEQMLRGNHCSTRFKDEETDLGLLTLLVDEDCRSH